MHGADDGTRGASLDQVLCAGGTERSRSSACGIDDDYLESEPSHEILGSAHEATRPPHQASD